MSGRVELKKIVDENGNSLIGPATSSPLDFEKENHWTTPLRLKYSRSSRRIARFEAEARLVVQTESETVEIADILHARNVTRSVGPRRFKLNELKQDGEHYTLNLTLYPGELTPGDWRNFSNSAGRILLVDEQGQTYNAPGASVLISDQFANLSIPYKAHAPQISKEKIGPPAKMLWQLPTQAREVVVPVRFDDLPMP